MRKRLITPYTQILANDIDDTQEQMNYVLSLFMDSILGATTGVAVGLETAIISASNRTISVATGVTSNGQGNFHEFLTSGIVTLPNVDETYYVYVQENNNITGFATSGFALLNTATQQEEFKIINTLEYDGLVTGYITTGTTLPTGSTIIARGIVAGGNLTTLDDYRQFVQLADIVSNSLLGLVQNNDNEAYITNKITGSILKSSLTPVNWSYCTIDNTYNGIGYNVNLGNNSETIGYKAIATGNIVSYSQLHNSATGLVLENALGNNLGIKFFGVSNFSKALEVNNSSIGLDIFNISSGKGLNINNATTATGVVISGTTNDDIGIKVSGVNKGLILQGSDTRGSSYSITKFANDINVSGNTLNVVGQRIDNIGQTIGQLITSSGNGASDNQYSSIINAGSTTGNRFGLFLGDFTSEGGDFTKACQIKDYTISGLEITNPSSVTTGIIIQGANNSVIVDYGLKIKQANKNITISGYNDNDTGVRLENLQTGVYISTSGSSNVYSGISNYLEGNSTGINQNLINGTGSTTQIAHKISSVNTLGSNLGIVITGDTGGLFNNGLLITGNASNFTNGIKIGNFTSEGIYIETSGSVNGLKIGNNTGSSTAISVSGCNFAFKGDILGRTSSPSGYIDIRSSSSTFNSGILAIVVKDSAIGLSVDNSNIGVDIHDLVSANPYGIRIRDTEVLHAIDITNITSIGNTMGIKMYDNNMFYGIYITQDSSSYTSTAYMVLEDSKVGTPTVSNANGIKFIGLGTCITLDNCYNGILIDADVTHPLVMIPKGSLPSSPTNGEIVVANTGSGTKIYLYNGSTWETVTSA